MQTERNPFRKVKLFIIGYFALLILLLTFIGIMDWMGFKMLDMTLEFAFFTLLICSALTALTVWIVQRIMRSWIKVVVGSLAGIIILALAMGIMSMMSMMMLYNIPMHHTTLTSPSGDFTTRSRAFLSFISRQPTHCRWGIFFTFGIVQTAFPEWDYSAAASGRSTSST